MSSRRFITSLCKELGLPLKELTFYRGSEYVYGDGYSVCWWELVLEDGTVFETEQNEDMAYALKLLEKTLREYSAERGSISYALGSQLTPKQRRRLTTLHHALMQEEQKLLSPLGLSTGIQNRHALIRNTVWGSDHHVYLMSRCGKVVGALYWMVLSEGALLLRGIYIHPAYRRQGLGERLLRHSLADMQQRFPDTPKTLFVIRSNHRALRLYNKVGFTTCVSTELLYTPNKEIQK